MHQEPVHIGSWKGSGYSIIDPELGVGSYRISGGKSGGQASDISSTIGYLLTVVGLGATLGQILEASVFLGAAIGRIISNVLGPPAVFYTVADTKIFVCDRATRLALTAFSITVWIGIVALGFYALPPLLTILIASAIVVTTAVIQETIKSGWPRMRIRP